MLASFCAGAAPGQALGVPCHGARVMLGPQIGEREDTGEFGGRSRVCRLPGGKNLHLGSITLHWNENTFQNNFTMCLMVQMSPETRGISTSISSIVAATTLVFQASCLLPLKAGLCKNIISLSISMVSIGPSISSITVCCKPSATKECSLQHQQVILLWGSSRRATLS